MLLVPSRVVSGSWIPPLEEDRNFDTEDREAELLELVIKLFSNSEVLGRNMGESVREVDVEDGHSLELQDVERFRTSFTFLLLPTLGLPLWSLLLMLAGGALEPEVS